MCPGSLWLVGQEVQDPAPQGAAPSQSWEFSHWGLWAESVEGEVQEEKMDGGVSALQMGEH